MHRAAGKRRKYFNFQRINLWQSHKESRDLLFNSAKTFARLACELEGIKVMRIWHDQALYKEPWANPTGKNISIMTISIISLFISLARGRALLEL